MRGSELAVMEEHADATEHSYEVDYDLAEENRKLRKWLIGWIGAMVVIIVIIVVAVGRS